MKIQNSTTPITIDVQKHLPGSEMFRHLLEILPVAVYTCDKNGYIIFYNKHAVDLWCREPEIGKDKWCGSWKIFTTEGILLPLDSFPMVMVLKSGKEIEQQEIIIERPDGKRQFINSYPKPLFDENGNLEGAMNMLVDITRGKSDEEKAAMLSSIVKSSNAAIISKTLNGIVTSWNPAAQHIFGYTSDEMIGQPIIKLIPHDLYHEEEEILGKLRKGEIIDHMETIRITKDGNLIDIFLTVSPVRDESGKIICVSKIARDISSVKRAERLIKESDERFRMAVEATKLGTWEYDLITQELTWSKECKRIYGLQEEEQID